MAFCAYRAVLIIYTYVLKQLVYFSFWPGVYINLKVPPLLVPARAGGPFRPLFGVLWIILG